MRRALAISSLAFACLCGTGLLWDIVQVVAWGRMFAGYARNESVCAAVTDTFDAEHPCALCQAVTAARDLAEHETPAPTSPGRATERVLFLAENTFDVVPQAAAFQWPADSSRTWRQRADDVPVPPPRT